MGSRVEGWCREPAHYMVRQAHHGTQDNYAMGNRGIGWCREPAHPWFDRLTMIGVINLSSRTEFQNLI
jgi:hypothetical protein